VSQLITIEEVAARLACKPAAIRKWRAQGKLKPVKLGRLVRFRAADIDTIATKGL
jgi:excisionase family DNA binding protein